MYLLLNMSVFHCYGSLLEGNISPRYVWGWFSFSTYRWDMWFFPEKYFLLEKADFQPAMLVYRLRVPTSEFHTTLFFFNSDWMWIDTKIIRRSIFPRTSYPSSHNHGSKKWVPPILVSVHLGWFSTSMIMGERVIQGWRFLPIVWRFLNTPPIQCKQVDHVFATLPDVRGSPQEM